MSRIHVLSDSLINKIAAGEVIERPASVLKELLENSVDAGATRVDITIEDGGRRLIAVSDDGCGMNEEELALAIQPHATSKLTHEDDLFAIHTMGFRGEALPSIGSVSQMRLVSRVADEPGGHEIQVDGGRIEGPRPTAAPVGTSIEVRELFFNVPARRKFLKTANTEIGHIVEQLIRIGLPHPHIHIVCSHNARRTHDLPSCGGPDVLAAIRDRIAAMLSAELAQAMIPIDRQERGLLIRGWVAPPAMARGTAAWQYTWLNGRFVRDRFLQHAVRESYRGLLPEGRFPVVFLFLEVPPADIDVNVHPTKIEVRFRDSNLVHSQVLAALRETFLKRDLTPQLTPEQVPREMPGTVIPTGDPWVEPPRPSGDAFRSGPPRPPELPPEAQQEMRRAMADFLRNVPPTQAPYPPSPQGPETRPFETSESQTRLPWDMGPTPAPTPPQAGTPYRTVLQLHNAYLVTETEDGLVIVDQHALHERILYQQLVERVTRGPLESQRLLLPETVDVTPTEMACLEGFGPLFERLGLDLTPFGPTRIAVQAVPSVLSDADVGEWISNLLRRLADKPDQAVTDEFLFEILESVACKAAVKAGDPLTPQEIESLLARRAEVEKSSSCPHGRPTTLHMSLTELAKQFKRT